MAFYRSATDGEPVREWLRELPAADRRAIGSGSGNAAGRLAHWHAVVPLAQWRLLGIAKQSTRQRAARLLFFAAEGKRGVVHGFIKKTQKTPVGDLELARRRMKEMTT